MIDIDNEIPSSVIRVDRNSRVPYYAQIIESIQERIENGQWQAGYQLPGESELCRMFNVSRTVIRQALGELVYEGLITRVKGKGTFIAEPKIGESLVQKLTGFYHDMAERGYEQATKVLEQDVIPASPKVASYLRLREGEEVLRLTRKRSVMGEPIVLVTTYLPYKLCQGLENEDFTNQSLYEALERKFNLTIVYGKRTVEAVPANEYEAEILETEKGAPLILLDSISYIGDGTPIEYYHALHRGDRTRFEVELVRYEERGTNRKPLGRTEVPPQGSAFITESNNPSRSEG
ncbi:MAG TPA: GntR family transcriptional regulator [Anaerolineae bacterium]|nr:GntR family transcriptional regulator [Anaerolineae bacterium]